MKLSISVKGMLSFNRWRKGARNSGRSNGDVSKKKSWRGRGLSSRRRSFILRLRD